MAADSAPLPAPRSRTRAELEAWLLEYLRRRVGVDLARIGEGDDAAALGLDSLEVEQMLGDLEAWLGRSLDVTVLIRLPTLSAFLDHVSDATSGAARARDSDGALNPYLLRQLRRMRFDREFVRGEGCYVEDARGRRYLDFVGGYGALPFGHDPQPIWRAVEAVRDRCEPNLIQLAENPAAAELARRLIQLVPPPLSHVTFANSGAEAVEAAIKLVRMATGRPGILSTDFGFHGKTLGALSATGNPDYQRGSGAPAADFVRMPFGDLAALSALLRARPDYFAALIIEPIQGEGGVIVPPPGYLRAAAELCRAAGVLLVLDEVQTGLGRTGALFAFEHEGVVPDVLLLAKALSGGLVPIGACISASDVYNEAFALKHSSTFAGNTLACRVGLAALAWITADDCALVENARRTGAYLQDRLNELARTYPDTLAEVRGRGLMLGLRIADGAKVGTRSILDVAREQGLAAPLVASLLLNVEFVRVVPTLNDSHVLRVQPPLTVTSAECDVFVRALEQTLQLLETGDAVAIARGLLHGERAPDSQRSARRGTTAARRNPPVRFGFVIHPLTEADYRHFDRFSAALSDADLAGISELAGDVLEPFVLGELEVRSASGTSASGVLAVVPRTAQQLLAAGEAQACALVQSAVELARQRGAQLVGLGGYTAVVTRGGERVRQLGCGITTGNVFTAITAYEAVDRALGTAARNIAELDVAIVGAAGSVGRNIAALAAERCGRLYLVGNPQRDPDPRLLEAALEIVRGVAAGPATAAGRFAREVGALLESGERSRAALERAVERLREAGLLVITPHATSVLAFADVVFTATSAPGTLFEAPDFREGAIVCDVSRPSNLPAALAVERPDLRVIAGGLVRVPSARGLQVLGLGSDIAYACLAETMLLALAGKADDFSIGARVSSDQIRLARELAAEAGFQVIEHHRG